MKDDPYHVFIETLLIAFLLYLLYGTRRAKNSQKKEQALTDKEIDDLVSDWAPAPLVGTASAPPPPPKSPPGGTNASGPDRLIRSKKTHLNEPSVLTS